MQGVFDLCTGSRPEEALMGLASGPCGVEYRLLALCSPATVLLIWVKYPAAIVLIGGLDSPVMKKSEFTPPEDKTFIFCWEQESPTAARAGAGETLLGIRIIFLSKKKNFFTQSCPAKNKTINK